MKFTAVLPQGLAAARRCTCSICRMRGAVAVTGIIDGFRITEGEDKLATYRFNTMTAEHHFCRICGIYTHHKRRSNPNQLGVNVACLEGLSPFDFCEVPVNDGERHPADNPEGKTYVAGVLRFEVAPAG
ncbi:MAG TPA: GFA family protein [Sphingomicrobium sp.]|nr:GFA family protein [Sphingomicrobium sp.]